MNVPADGHFLPAAELFPVLADWPAWEIRLIAPFQGAGVVIAIVLIILTLFLLPRGKKRLIRGPLIGLGLLICFLGMHVLLPEAAHIHLPFEFLAVFCLLCTIGRCFFLLLVRCPPFSQVFAAWPKIFLDVLQAFIYLGALLITLNAAGVKPESLITGSALVTAAIGLSMKDTLGNIFAGLAIHGEHPFEVGDWIQFDQQPQHIGEVLEINWRATKVFTLDKVVVIIPNSVLAQAPIRNFTKPERYSRRSIFVYAPYDVPTQHVQKIILDAVSEAWGVLRDPPPSVVTNGFTDRGVEFWVRIFTNDFDKRDKVDGGVRDRIWYAFQRYGIVMPGVLREVQMHEVTPAGQAAESVQDFSEREQALREIDFLDGLPPEAVSRLAAHAQQRLYSSDETVIRQGARGDEFFIVLRGEMSVRLQNGDGAPFEVTRLGPGKFFGEMGMMTGQPRTATVVATQESELLAVGKEALQPILAASPDLAEHISETLVSRRAALDAHAAQRPVPSSDALKDERGDLLQRIRDFFGL